MGAHGGPSLASNIGHAALFGDDVASTGTRWRRLASSSSLRGVCGRLGDVLEWPGGVVVVNERSWRGDVVLSKRSRRWWLGRCGWLSCADRGDG